MKAKLDFPGNISKDEAMELESHAAGINTELKLIARGFLSSSFFYPISIGFGYLLNIILARTISQHQLGLYNLFNSFAGIFYILCAIGLPTAIKRYDCIYAKESVEKRRFFFYAVTICILLAGLLGGLTLYFGRPIFVKFYGASLASLCYLYIFFIPLRSLIISLNCFFISSLRPSIYYMIDTFSTKIGLLLLLLSTIVFFSLQSAAQVISLFIITSVLTLSVILCIFNKLEMPLMGRISWIPFKEQKDIFLFSLPCVFASLFAMIFLYTDNIMLGSMMGEKEVAIYNIAFVLASLAQFIPCFPLQSMLVPVMTKMYEIGNIENMKVTLRLLGKLAFMCSLPLVSGLLIVSQELISIVFGVKYSSGALPFEILCFFYLLTNIFPFGGSIATIVKKTKILSYTTLISLFVCVFLNWFLIPIWGMSGAAIATGTAIFLNSLLILLLLGPEYFMTMPWAENILISLVYFAFLFSAIYFWKLNLIGSISVYLFLVMLFFISLWFGSYLSKNEKKILYSLIGSKKN